jgi:uncharacterized protein YlaI
MVSYFDKVTCAVCGQLETLDSMIANAPKRSKYSDYHCKDCEAEILSEGLFRTKSFTKLEQGRLGKLTKFLFG